MKENYLITGAAGFIGSSVANRFIANGHNVYTIDNLSTGSSKNIDNKVEFIEGNCYDNKLLQKLDRIKFDAIIHIAGQSSGEISFDNPIYDLKTNTQSTLNLISYAMRTRCNKFIFTSTMSVYGDQVSQPVHEEVSKVPKSFYAVGKLASEQYLNIYGSMGISCTSLRLFNVYGPNQNMENLRQGMISIFLAQAIKNNSILVKGSKDRYRDHIYIDDVIDVYEKVSKIHQNRHTIYNVGTGIKVTVEELINEISKYFFDLEVEYKGNTPGDMHGIYANIEKIKKDLNWEPKINIKSGLKKMCEWLLNK